MKKILLPILIACVSALPTQAQTVLTVDVSNVFNNLKEVQTEIAKLNSAAEEYRNFLQDRVTKIQTDQKKVEDLVAQSNNQAILQDSRDTYKKEAIAQDQILNTEKAEAQQFQTQSNGVIQERQDGLVKAELDKIRTVVKQIAADKKASIVLNSSNLNMLSSVLFTAASVDVTQDVVTKLNADYAAAAPAAAPAAASGSGMAAKPADTTKKM
jgi:Skp family chaperone for outer membrane proteins